MLPQKASVASVWDKRLEYGYPVPYVERNMHVHAADEAPRPAATASNPSPDPNPNLTPNPNPDPNPQPSPGAPPARDLVARPLRLMEVRGAQPGPLPHAPTLPLTPPYPTPTQVGNTPHPSLPYPYPGGQPGPLVHARVRCG